MNRLSRGPLSTAALALALLAPGRAQAQACCSTTGSQEFGVVGRCTTAVVAAQLAAEHAIGSFDASSGYHALDGAVDSVTLSLGAGVRLWPSSLQLHGNLPVRLQRRDLPGLEPATAVGVGDATLALRWTAIEDEDWLPYLDLYVGMRMPTGRAPEDSEEPSGADVTGDGTWSPFVGTKIAKLLGTHHIAQLQVQYTLRLAHEIPAGASGETTEFSPGDVWILRGSWIYVHDIYLSGGPFLQVEFTGSAEQDDETVADSDGRRVRFGAHVAWAFDHPIWEANLAASSDAFWDGAAKNVPFAGPALALTISRHFP